jgi:hypothetical protein
MKKVFLTIFFLLLAGSVFAQEFIINSFDEAEADTNYWLFFQNDNAVEDSSFINVSFDSSDFAEGAASMRLDFRLIMQKPGAVSQNSSTGLVTPPEPTTSRIMIPCPYGTTT